MNLRAVDLGFSAHGVLTMSLVPAVRGDDSSAEPHCLEGKCYRACERCPGVQTASLSALSPLSGRDSARFVTIAGFQATREEDRLVHVNHVSEDYFRTFGIVLSSGRTSQHTTQRRAEGGRPERGGRADLLQGRNPIGETFRFSDTEAISGRGCRAGCEGPSLRRQRRDPCSFRSGSRSRTTVASPWRSVDRGPTTLARTVAREIQSIDPARSFPTSSLSMTNGRDTRQ